MKPMLADSIDLDSLDHYTKNPEWVYQQKLDGDRLMILVENGKVSAVNRAGEPRRNAVPITVLTQFAQLSGSWSFDGELLGSELWLFDLPHAATESSVLVSTKSTLEYRLAVLEQFYARWQPTAGVRLLPTAYTASGKEDLASQVQAHSGEGLILKHRNGLYRPGRRDRLMLKAKFTHTIDVFVSAVNVDGKTNCHVSVYDELGQATEVGSISMHGKPKVSVGDVIEVLYLYASEDSRLFQPRLLRIRTDKTPLECDIDQLVFTDRSVLDFSDHQEEAAS